MLHQTIGPNPADVPFHRRILSAVDASGGVDPNVAVADCPTAANLDPDALVALPPRPLRREGRPLREQRPLLHEEDAAPLEPQPAEEAGLLRGSGRDDTLSLDHERAQEHRQDGRAGQLSIEEQACKHQGRRGRATDQKPNYTKDESQQRIEETGNCEGRVRGALG